ncbi:hypothetical protein SB48_HM08orf01397 [Heyndrickxia coagulans]|uniref:Uncharacterized protein n=1 Tax=Heyndrickxia coagulans TaxID=1398 RepID=A0AAN0WB72_HEYCO|nr:hypothetical protein SB48_HM08orf01397 [Heyndrickxia coagulans]KYC62000.1 hypothetical protein B4100_2217 [Heyndrickxia coagulans]
MKYSELKAVTIAVSVLVSVFNDFRQMPAYPSRFPLLFL